MSMGLVCAILSAPLSANDDLVISELMAKNESTLATAAGTFEDWVEIHNGTGAPVDLAGWYLTDDPSDLRKWQFPSTGATSPLADDSYLIVFADGSEDAIFANELHASFKLGSGGEYLALVRPDGETIVHQYTPDFPAQSADVSYGIDGGSKTLTFFSTPTPGARNSQAISDAVGFSASSQTFTSAFELTLSTPSPTTVIRYTLDGSIPTSSSTAYNNSTPIPINATTQVRARSFKSGLIDGPVRSESFLRINNDAAAFSSDLPVIVIENFAQGDIPHPDDVERQSCQVMIFEPKEGLTRLTDEPVISSRGGMRRRGESSLRSSNSKPNISLETWAEIDEESRSIDPLGLPADSDWVLYAPWTIDTAMIRNPFIYEVSNEAGQYAVRTRYVEVFLNHGGGTITGNDDYYGLYILMEKIKQGPNRVDIAKLPATVTSEPDLSGGYIWKLDKPDPDDQNFTAAGKEPTAVYPKDMPAVQLNWLANSVTQIDNAVPDGDYESLIDVRSFVDHHILNVFTNNADGLRLSTYYHKDREGRMKMGPIWDFDRSMACDNDERASNPEVWSLATNELHFFRSSSLLWFRSLALSDPDFWMLWVDRWQAMREAALSNAAIDRRIEDHRTEISAAALRNYNRWSGFLSASEWSGKVDVMKDHVLRRAQWIDDQLIDPPTLNHSGGLVSPGFQLSVSGPETKYFTVNGDDPRAPGGNPTGTAYGSAITITENTLLKVRANNGVTFTDAPTTWPWSAMTEAMFVVDPAPLAVTEIMYHPRPPSGAAEAGFSGSDFEFIEIQNTSDSACSLIGVKLLDGVAFDFSEAAVKTLEAGAHALVVRNTDAFKARYPNWASLNILGEFDGKLSDGSEEVELGYEAPNVPALARFSYHDDWYPATDGEGFSLTLRDADSDSASWGERVAWRHSAAVDGSPGMDDPSPAYPQGSLVINELVANPGVADQGSWIEIHNTTGSGIDIGGWFLSDSRGSLKKYSFPASTIVPPNGYLVFNETDHYGSAFNLNAYGDSLFLSAGDGNALSEPAYRENVTFGAQNPGVSFGRHLRSDQSVSFPALSSATMGSTNEPPMVGPLVIDEIMYHPPIGGHEYLVIRNTGTETVNLYDPENPFNRWKLSGIGFTFPAATELAGGGSLILLRDTTTPSQFRLENAVPPSIEIISYNGALDNDSDSLVLKQPANPDPSTGYTPFIDVEQVNYRDRFPWPAEADGAGSSLSRITASEYADDSSNWQAIDASYRPTVFSLSVLSGTGSGIYTAGTVIPLQANNPAAGQSFVEWIGNVSAIADPDNPATFLTMPAQNMTITALSTVQMDLITGDASWKYHDQGQDLGTAWRTLTYNDSSWPEGAAQLGYGEGDETTVIGFGGTNNDKHITTYFRKKFRLDDPAALGSLTLELLRDDGAVVFLNGVEVVRDNLPVGNIDHLTLASTTVGGESEDSFYRFEIPLNVLVGGLNILAVEIHQRSPDSSDVSFAARLSTTLRIDRESLDGDRDDMHDAWEVVHFGSTEAGHPELDGDNDGTTNKDEFVAGTLPGDPGSFFAADLAPTSIPSAGYEISWTEIPGRVYSVYWTDDLRTPFVPIANAVANGIYIDTEHNDNPTGFYRVDVRLEE